MTREIISDRAGLVLLVGALLITTGCLQGGGVGGEEVSSDSLDSMESVDTYAFDTETDIEAKAGGGGEDSLSVTFFLRGTASESMDRMRTSSNLVINEETADQEMYVKNGSAYVRLRTPGGGESDRDWFKMDSDAASSAPVERHIGLLEASEVEYEGEETVNNESAHVLSANTGTEEYEEFVLGTAEVPLRSAGIVTPTLLENAEVGNASLRYWVSDDTDRILRVRSTANLSSTVPNAEDDVEMVVETETTFTSYNGEVNMEAPEGIESAEEFEGAFSGSSSSSSQRVSEGGEAGAASYASEGGVVDVMRVRFRDSGGNETSTATVTTNPITADTITAEAVESGDKTSVEDVNASREELVLELNPEGDKVVVRVTRGNETEVVYNQTVSSE